MPYNLRPRKIVRDIPVPRRGDRVTIFWSTLETAYSGRLTKYDPVHKTFLVVYDHTPRGFDDHRIWEALDLVPWRFEHGVEEDSESGSEQDDADEMNRQWFQPGELGTAHPQFRADASAVNSESEDESAVDSKGDDDNDEDENDNDGDDQNDDNDECDDEGESNRNDPEEGICIYGEHEDPVETSHEAGDESQKQGDDEDREASEEHLSAGSVQPSEEQRETGEVVRHHQVERRGEQVQVNAIQEPERDQDSDSSFEDSLGDGLAHPSLASKNQTSKGDASQASGHLHSHAGGQVRKARNVQIGSKRSEDEYESCSSERLCKPPLALARQSQRRSRSQQVEYFERQAAQEARYEHKRKAGPRESENDTGNAARDSLYHSSPAGGQRAKRRKRSQSAQQHPKIDRTAQYGDDANGNASQHYQGGKGAQFSHRASHSGTTNRQMDRLYHPPLAPQQQKSGRESSLRGVQCSASPIAASSRERYDSRGSPHIQTVFSSKPVPTRNERGPLQKLQKKRIRGSQHGLEAPQRESTGIMNLSLSQNTLTPQRKALRRNASNSAVSHPRLTETENHNGEQQLFGSERRAQQDPEDITSNNPPHVPPATNRKEAMRDSVRDSTNPHFVEKRESKLERELEHAFRERGYPPIASVRESIRETATSPVQIRVPQGRDSQANRDPRKRRRYLNFGPSGFSHFNTLRNAEHQQRNDPVQFYQRDTVHINVSREMQERDERRLSHHTNHDSFRVFTGHHVPHSDMPSVEDQIKSITKTLGVPKDGSNDRRSL